MEFASLTDSDALPHSYSNTPVGNDGIEHNWTRIQQQQLKVYRAMDPGASDSDLIRVVLLDSPYCGSEPRFAPAVSTALWLYLPLRRHADSDMGRLDPTGQRTLLDQISTATRCVR